MSALQTQIDLHRPLGEHVCRKIGEAIVKIGLSTSALPILPEYHSAGFTLVTDPYSQQQDLVGYWFDAQRQKIGQLQFHADGSFYAEYDVIQPHPRQAGAFVEAMHAWGRDGAIKTEAKLLDLPK
jgi:hypothetical protein